MFIDRRDAGRQLAARLQGRPLVRPLVLAIPRGGVVVGAEIATALKADLDVVMIAKLTSPNQPEYALGAVSEDGEVALNPDAGDTLVGIENELRRERQRQLDLLLGRARIYRGDREASEVAGRSVIVTDDGVATGSTLIAALKFLRQREAHELIVAVPAGPADKIAEIKRECDQLVCLTTSSRFSSVGHFYEDFSPVEEQQVVTLLRQASQRQAIRTAAPPPASDE